MSALALRAGPAHRRPVPAAGPASALSVLGAVAAAVALGAAAAVVHPAVAIAAALAALAAVVVLARPELGVPVAAAALTANVAAIAVSRHGVPAVGAALVVPALLLVPAVERVVRRRERLGVTPVVGLLAAFAVVQAVSALLSPDPSRGVADVVTTFAEGLVPTVLFVAAARTRSDVRRAVLAVAAVAALLAGVGVAQRVAGATSRDVGGLAQVAEVPDMGSRTLDERRDDAPPRSAGPIGEPNRWAQVLVAAIPLALAGAAGARRRRTATAAWAVAAVALLGGIAATGSRGAVIGVAAVAAAALALRAARVRHLAVAAAVVTVVVLAVPGYRERVASITRLSGATSQTAQEDGADGSVRSRITEGAAAALAFGDHPVLGVGPGRFPVVYAGYAGEVGIRVKPGEREAHDLYLHIAAETGVVGLAVFLAVIAAAWREAARARLRWRAAGDERSAAVAVALQLALVAHLATGIFLHLSYARYLWVVVALCAAAGSVARREVPA